MLNNPETIPFDQLSQYDKEQFEYWGKQFRRMAAEPMGRRALSAGTGFVFVDKEDAKDSPEVALLVPSYRDMAPKMKECAERLLHYSRQRINVHTPPQRGAAIPHMARNALLCDLYKSGVPFTHVLMSDDDMTFPQDALLRMLDRKKDIVAGLFTTRADPVRTMIRRFDPETKMFRDFFDWNQGDLVECDATGMGFVLLSRAVIEAVAEWYMSCAWEKFFFDVSDEWAEQHSRGRRSDWDLNKYTMWFRCLPELNDRREYGEDIAFFLGASQCGFKTYVDTSILVGHVGEYEFSYYDFEDNHRAIKVGERAKVSPKAEVNLLLKPQQINIQPSVVLQGV